MRKSSLKYPVEFVDDVFGESPALAKMLRKISGNERPRVHLIADFNVVNHTDGIGPKIGRYVKDNNIELAERPIILGGSEKIKLDFGASANKTLDIILAAGVKSDDVVVILGGGAVLDVGAYAIAQISCGMKTLRMPTTPAAMMSAAFLEYAAMNRRGKKDILRIPSQPDGVIIDTAFAVTVLDGVWRGGFGEAVRMVMGSSAKNFAKLKNLAAAYKTRDKAALDEVVKLTVSTRMKDGPRDFALGTAARLEELSNFVLPHGYAVSIATAIECEESREVLAESGALETFSHSARLIRRFLATLPPEEAAKFSLPPLLTDAPEN